jgi:hypothetical protein
MFARSIKPVTTHVKTAYLVFRKSPLLVICWEINVIDSNSMADHFSPWRYRVAAQERTEPSNTQHYLALVDSLIEPEVQLLRWLSAWFMQAVKLVATTHSFHGHQ